LSSLRRVIQEIKAKQTTGDRSGFSYVTMLLQGVLWAIYGLLQSALPVLVVNLGCIACGSYYVFVYYTYTPQRAQFQRLLLQSAGFTMAVLLFVFGFTEPGKQASTLGLIASGFTVLMFGSPLVSIKQVIVSRSTEVLDKTFTIVMVVHTFVWTSYGFSINDPYVLVPNALGFALAISQLSLFIFYPSATPPALPSPASSLPASSSSKVPF
jgi:solute carrier family 50 protein (sugar transporter)